MPAATTHDAPSTGIVRASALPPLALRPSPPLARWQPAVPHPPAAEPPARRWPHLLAPLGSRAMRVLAFDAVVLGALLSFVTDLLALGTSDGGRGMLLAALLLTSCWIRVLAADLRRLLTLLRRWH